MFDLGKTTFKFRQENVTSFPLTELPLQNKKTSNRTIFKKIKFYSSIIWKVTYPLSRTQNVIIEL